MPYKNGQRKKAWEILHRDQRLARRRELRRIEAAKKEPHPETTTASDSAAAVMIPFAFQNPKLLMAAGGGALAFALIKKKGASWFLFGVLILVIGLVLQLSKNENDRGA